MNKYKELWNDLRPEEKQLFTTYVDDVGLYDVELEQTFLGMCLSPTISEMAVYSSPNIAPQHFYFAAHQALFAEIQKACARGEAPEPVALAKYAASHPEFADVARAAGKTEAQYMMVLASCTPSSLNQPKVYANQIVEYYERRKLVYILRDGFIRARDSKLQPEVKSVLDDVMLHIADLGCSSSVKPLSFDFVTKKIVENISRPSDATPTGIAKLDDALQGGFYPGKTYCFSAVPKAGKSMLMGSILYNMTMAGNKVEYYAFEMGSEELHYRYLARFLGINAAEFYRKRCDPIFAQKVMEAERVLSEQKLKGTYIDCPGMRFDELKRSVMASSRRAEVRGIFLDYMGKIKGQKKNQGRADFEEEVADWLHSFAKKEGIWVCYACQLNREGKIRGGDGALMGADAVYLIERHEESNTAHLKCEASRYTARIDVGKSAANPGLRIGTGPYYRCATDPMESDLSDMEKMMGMTDPTAYYDELLQN